MRREIVLYIEVNILHSMCVRMRNGFEDMSYLAIKFLQFWNSQIFLIHLCLVPMDAKLYHPERRGLQFSDFEMPTSDDDSSVLLSNTNKLLSAVGISAKKIISTEELSRVASSMIVAVFESLFHQKIDGIVRNPTSIKHYERNAQLVIDSLSDQIQLDLQHITGKSIVSGDLRVLSNLVHILVRIVSLTRCVSFFLSFPFYVSF